MTPGAPPEIEAAAQQLTPYQIRWITNRYPRKLCVKSRRIGGTYMAALDGAWRAAGYDPCLGLLRPETGERVNIVSASFNQAKEFLNYCAKHLRQLEELPEDVERVIPIAQEHGLPITPGVLLAMVSALHPRPKAHAEHVFVPRNKKIKNMRNGSIIDGEPLVDRIYLTNGVMIIAFAANPRTIRGFEGHVILDEFGVMPFADRIWAAAASLADENLGMRSGYTLSVLGTPCGDSNMFAKLAITGAGQSFSRHRITIFDAHAQGHPLNPEKVRGRYIGTPEIFEQEYNCAFLSDATQYIDMRELQECLYATTPEGLLEYQQVLDVHRHGMLQTSGLDVAVAERGDRSVLVRNQLLGKVRWMTPTIRRGRGVSFETQKFWVKEEFRDKVWRVAVDGTGLGYEMAQELSRPSEFGSAVLHVRFNPQVKEAMATRAKQWFQLRRQRIPDDQDLIRSFLNLHRTINAAGTRFLYDTKHEESGHGDEAWALMLAQHAETFEGGPFETKRAHASRRAGVTS